MSLDVWRQCIDWISKNAEWVVAALAVSGGWWQYRRDQHWRKLEWAAGETGRLLSDPVVKQALLMIDWWDRYVILFPNHPDPALRSVRVDDDVIARALLHHSHCQQFKPIEAAIRDVFDDFLDGLSRLQQFVASKLVKPEELKPYLRYWLERMTTVEAGHRPSARHVQLSQYIRDYKFEDVQKLLRLLDYRLHEQSGAETARLKGLDTGDWRSRFADPLFRPKESPSETPSTSPPVY